VNHLRSAGVSPNTIGGARMFEIRNNIRNKHGAALVFGSRAPKIDGHREGSMLASLKDLGNKPVMREARRS
jgi:hypothetical protein